MLRGGVSQVLTTNGARQQSGQVFIAQVAGKSALAPEERNTLLTEAKHSLLRTFKILCDRGSINIGSLWDRRPVQPPNSRTEKIGHETKPLVLGRDQL